MDIESLRSAVESYKTTSYPQGDVTKLAEYVLEKLRPTNSDHGHLHLIEYDDVKLRDFLGKGSFGAVFKCVFLGEKAAAKVFAASRPTEVDLIQKEAKLQARSQHPNVVQFIGYAAKGNQHMIVSELMSNDLRSYLDETVHTGKDCLGIGGYAPVFKCKYHGEMAAAKMFCISKIDDVKRVENEASLQPMLQHPNVVQFIGYAVRGTQHLILTELMSKDLRLYRDENISEGQATPPLSLPLAVHIMLKIAEGMKYLQESRVMHRDLRANNVLINVVENKELYTFSSVQVKITDFGMSKLNLNNSRFTTMGRGNTQWRAPEVFQEEQNTEKYTNAADVYSFALVFYEVLTSEVPFANISKSQILGKIRCGERPILPPDDYCPVHLSAFIKECWATRPEDRPKFPEICQRLRECEDTILSHSTPNASSQNSKP
ncbi:hypothetical protein BDL97_10G011700 [Sphagnum fallax]|nr:hypothetical protein BDL97_10G011700 [Sphagnum fallax]